MAPYTLSFLSRHEPDLARMKGGSAKGGPMPLLVLLVREGDLHRPMPELFEVFLDLAIVLPELVSLR